MLHVCSTDMYAHVTHHGHDVLYCVLWYCGTVVLYGCVVCGYCVLWYCGTVVLCDCVTETMIMMSVLAVNTWMMDIGTCYDSTTVTQYHSTTVPQYTVHSTVHSTVVPQYHSTTVHSMPQQPHSTTGPQYHSTTVHSHTVPRARARACACVCV